MWQGAEFRAAAMFRRTINDFGQVRSDEGNSPDGHIDVSCVWQLMCSDTHNECHHMVLTKQVQHVKCLRIQNQIHVYV